MTHLRIEDRLQIETLLNRGDNPTEIAQALGRKRAAIHAEIKRNAVNGNYCHNVAQTLTDDRRANAKQSILTEENWTVVISLLLQKWSPEQISGWLKANPEMGFYVSDQWIYQYVDNDRAKDGTLYTHLRRAGKPYKSGGKRKYRGKIKNRIDIDNRPELINTRIRIGDWEVDSVLGAMNKSSIVTLVERKSRYTAILKVMSKEANEVAKAIIARASSDRIPVYSITGDNGTEFAEHEKISEALGIAFYFTHPYSSWEKGTNENTNGLIRQYFPKGTDFKHISSEALREVEDALNNRPRKCLQYKSPREVIAKSVRL